jgi:hypothetical protein
VATSYKELKISVVLNQARDVVLVQQGGGARFRAERCARGCPGPSSEGARRPFASFNRSWPL